MTTDIRKLARKFVAAEAIDQSAQERFEEALEQTNMARASQNLPGGRETVASAIEQENLAMRSLKEARLYYMQVHEEVLAAVRALAQEPEPPTVEHQAITRPDRFRSELQKVINGNSMENGSNTPDVILAAYLHDCLRAFDVATLARDQGYGVELRPGMERGQ